MLVDENLKVTHGNDSTQCAQHSGFYRYSSTGNMQATLLLNIVSIHMIYRKIVMLRGHVLALQNLLIGGKRYM